MYKYNNHILIGLVFITKSTIFVINFNYHIMKEQKTIEKKLPLDNIVIKRKKLSVPKYPSWIKALYKTQRFIEEMKQEAQAAENYG